MNVPLSPRMRGCFPHPLPRADCRVAFPAYAGMFLNHTNATAEGIGFPRVCGDVSDRYSGKQLYHQAFPAYAGMFPMPRHPGAEMNGFPRVCGDVSTRFARPSSHAPAFPAYAGMFLKSQIFAASSGGFPRVCGDVSLYRSRTLEKLWLSPRMRGCFQSLLGWVAVRLAFPAYAGMFPAELTTGAEVPSFPRVCGDVSQIVIRQIVRTVLSPRMRGCFSEKLDEDR